MFRYHVSSVLCMIAENTARMVRDGGRYSTMDLFELLHMDHGTDKTGQQLVDELAKKMGLEVIETESA